MSLITQCPACATMFKVVADQLRISEGWVRCGQCDEAFDANAHLRPPAPGHSAPASAPAPAPTPVVAPTPRPTARPEPTHYDWTGIVDIMKELEEPVPPPKPVAPAPPLPVAAPVPDAPWVQQVQAIAQSEPLPRPLAESPPVRAPAPKPTTTSTVAFDPASDPASELMASSAGLLIVKPGLVTTPTYDARPSPGKAPGLPGLLPGTEGPVTLLMPAQLPPGKTKAGRAPVSRLTQPPEVQSPPSGRWHGLATAALVCGAVVLALALALQVVIYQRDWLLAYQPALKPVLQSLCNALSCKLSPLQRIDVVSIESWKFSKVRDDVYKLSVTVKNTGPIPIAKPWLELTLTDAQDQAVLRKVLPPTAFGNTNDTLPAANEFGGVLAISATPPPDAPPIAGYRVLAFYP